MLYLAWNIGSSSGASPMSNSVTRIVRGTRSVKRPHMQRLYAFWHAVFSLKNDTIGSPTRRLIYLRMVSDFLCVRMTFLCELNTS
jgi:hypothetical protein